MSKKRTSRQTRAATKQNMDSRAPVMTMDAFSNPAARIGFGTLDLLQATEYPMTRMTQNYQLLTSLYRENWIIQNIISTIPNDMMRKWYDLRTSVAPEYLKQMTQLERRTQIRKKLLLGMYWGRLYGGAVGGILIKGFVYALTQLETPPSVMLFYNGGARLTAQDSPCIEDLKTLQEQGTKILTCGTCVNFYGLKEPAVGTVTNMYTIAEKLTKAGKVIRP